MNVWPEAFSQGRGRRLHLDTFYRKDKQRPAPNPFALNVTGFALASKGFILFILYLSGFR